MERVEEENQQLKAQAQEQQNRIAQLETQIRELEEQRHNQLLDEVVEARIKAGWAQDQAKEREHLASLNEEPLKILLEDARKASTQNTNQPPKAQYKAQEDELQATIEDTRMRLFGHRRDA